MSHNLLAHARNPNLEPNYGVSVRNPVQNNQFQDDDFFAIYQFFVSNLLQGANKLRNTDAPLQLPIIPEKTVIKLCTQITKIFQSEPIILRLTDSFIVVGDIHGHIMDLIRILKRFGVPPKTRYLFLGDLVDRGEFSLETVIFIYILKVLFPNDVFIIRGNHEFEEICSTSSFIYEITSTYKSDELFQYFINTFDYMPLSAIMNDTIFCLHAGIGPNFHSIRDIIHNPAFPTRPIHNFSNDIITSMVWSDPSDESFQQSFTPSNNQSQIKSTTPKGIKYANSIDIFGDDLIQNSCKAVAEQIEADKSMLGFRDSPRGYGYLFDKKSFNDFMNNSGFETMIRGHQCVYTGIDSKFDNRLVTVFSASHYCGKTSNGCGVFIIDQFGVRTEVFSSLPYRLRNEAHFVNSINKDSFVPPLNDRLLSNTRTKLGDSPKLQNSDKITNNQSKDIFMIDDNNLSEIDEKESCSNDEETDSLYAQTSLILKSPVSFPFSPGPQTQRPADKIENVIGLRQIKKRPTIAGMQMKRPFKKKLYLF